MSKRFIGARQTTVAREVEMKGTGVHSGAPVSLVLHPADANTGLRFLVSKRGRIVAEIPADVRFVKNLTLCTVIGDDTGASISTVEHLLAALRGLGVDNCYIEVDSKEVPIMDGSSAPFVKAIDEAGIAELSEPRTFIKVLKPVRVRLSKRTSNIAVWQSVEESFALWFLATSISPCVHLRDLRFAHVKFCVP